MGASMGVTNWIVGLLLLTVMVIKLLWGADLVMTAYLVAGRSWWAAFVDGAHWLGWYFITSAIAVYGVLGWFLLLVPFEVVPLWFAVPAALFTIECTAAWHFLRQPTQEDGHGPRTPD